MAYMMGIDVGTTCTRAVVVRPDGHLMGFQVYEEDV